MSSFSLRSLMNEVSFFLPPMGTDAVLNHLALDRAYLEQLNQRIFFKGYYDERIEELRAFFKDQNFDVAAAAFDLLLDLKKDLMRKNGYIPDYGHEIDQLLPIMTLIKTGAISAEDLEEIKKQHGSIEQWFCAIITHDIGEDFGYFGDALIDALKKRLPPAENPAENDETGFYYDIMIGHMIKGMEVLTHDRKFSANDVQKITGQDFKMPRLKKGETLRLRALEDSFSKKMGLSGDDNKNFMVYARFNDKKNKPEIIVTRYGGEDENGRHFTDWNLYIQTVLSYNIFVALTKLGDRVTGMVSRPYINNDDPNAYSTYISHTSALFNISGAAHMMKENFYPDSPLIKYAISISKMMGVAQRCGRLYLSHHPLYDSEGRKGFSPGTLRFNEKALGGNTILYISEYFPMAMVGYPYNPDHLHSHPIAVLTRDLRACFDPQFHNHHSAVYSVIIDALGENCKHGVHPKLFEPLEEIQPDADHDYAPENCCPAANICNGGAPNTLTK